MARLSAEPLYQRALGIWEKSSAADPGEVSSALVNYAALLRKTNRAAEAEKLEARAQAIRSRQPASNPPAIAVPAAAVEAL